MNKTLGTILLALCLSWQNVSAQSGTSESDVLDNTLTDIYIVTGTTLSGGILGLSTLSFVSDPSANLNHVVVGSALGVILGVAIVAWRQANKSKDYYYENAPSQQAAADPLEPVRATTFSRTSFDKRPKHLAFYGPRFSLSF